MLSRARSLMRIEKRSTPPLKVGHSNRTRLCSEVKKERTISGLLTDFNQPPSKKGSQYSRKSRSQSDLKRPRDCKSELTTVDRVKLSNFHQQVLNQRPQRKRFQDVFLTDGRVLHRHTPSPLDLNELLEKIHPAQINNRKLDYEFLYLPNQKSREMIRTETPLPETLSVEPDKRDQENAPAELEQAGQLDDLKTNFKEAHGRATEQKPTETIPNSYRHIQNLKNTIKAVKTIKTLLKRRSEDYFDNSLNRIIEETNRRVVNLKCVLGVTDCGKWLYVWLGRVDIHIEMNPHQRLKMDVRIHYTYKCHHRTLQFSLSYTYDIVKLCKRMPTCLNDIELVGLIYHHYCGRRQPFNESVDLYALKQFLRGNIPVSQQHRGSRPTFQIIYDQSQSQYKVQPASLSTKSTSNPPILKRQSKSMIGVPLKFVLPRNDLISTVHYAKLQIDLDQMMQPVRVGVLNHQEKKETQLFGLHRQFEYSFIRPSSTDLLSQHAEYLVLKGSVLLRIGLHSNMIEMVFAKQHQVWLQECILLLKMHFVLNKSLAVIASKLLLDERAKQQQRILQNSDPQVRCVSLTRCFRRKRHFITLEINDREKKVKVLVASAFDRSLRQSFQFSFENLRSTYESVCSEILEPTSDTKVEQQCSKLIGLLEVEQTLTYSQLSLPLCLHSVFPKRLPGRTVGNKYCLKLPSGIYCMCFMLVCSISEFRYFFCYVPRSQKCYLRLIESYEDESQALDSIKQDMCTEVVTRRSLLTSFSSATRNDGMMMSSGLKKRKLMARREGIRSGSIRQSICFSEQRLKENCAVRYCQIGKHDYVLVGNVFRSAIDTNSQSESSELEIKLYVKHRTTFFRWTGNLFSTLRNVIGVKIESKRPVRAIIDILLQDLLTKQYRSHHEITCGLAQLLEGKPGTRQQHNYYAYVGGQMLEINRTISQNSVRVSLLQDDEPLELKHQEVEDLSEFLVKQSNNRIARRIYSVVSWYQRIGYI